MTHEKERLPEKVYIQFHEHPPTWCPHRTHDDDVEYTRTPSPELNKELALLWPQLRDQLKTSADDPMLDSIDRIDEIIASSNPSPELPEGVKMVDVAGLKKHLLAYDSMITDGEWDSFDIEEAIDEYTLTNDGGGGNG